MSIPPSASVAYRLPVVSSVARAEALASLGPDHDALPISPKMLDLELMPHGTKNIHCIGRQAVLDENLIGKPLMMKPGDIDRCLNIEFEVDHIYQDIRNRGNDFCTAR